MGNVELNTLDKELLASLPQGSKDSVRIQLEEHDKIKKTLMETGLHIAIKRTVDQYNNPCVDIMYFDRYTGKEGKPTTSIDLSVVRLVKDVDIKEVGAYLISRLSKQYSENRLPSQAYDVPNLLKDGVLYMTREDFEAFQNDNGEKGLAALLK